MTRNRILSLALGAALLTALVIGVKKAVNAEVGAFAGVPESSPCRTFDASEVIEVRPTVYALPGCDVPPV